MPRILCLHGHGTSSEIYEKQLQGVKNALPQDYELVFADGDIETDRAPGIPQVVPGPFLSYFDSVSCDSQRAAHELLQIIIEEDGPFDGVFAFSQGASLTLSYLLDLQRQEPGGIPPFKFAIFFAPNVVLGPDPAFLTQEIDKFDELDFTYFSQILDDLSDSGASPSSSGSSETDRETLFLDTASSGYQTDIERRKEIYISHVGATLRAGSQMGFVKPAEFKESALKRDTSAIPRIFHPALISQRIKIPTVHVTGTKDHELLRDQFKVLPYLYEGGRLREVIHSGGHDIPRVPAEIKEVVDAIQDAWAQSGMLVY